MGRGRKLVGGSVRAVFLAMEPPSKRRRTEVDLTKDKIESLSYGGPQMSFYLNRLEESISRSTTAPLISFNEIITSSAQSCILTTYMADVEWILKSAPRLHEIPCMLAHGDKELLASSPPLPHKFHLRYIRVKMPFGTCHGKIILVRMLP